MNIVDRDSDTRRRRRVALAMTIVIVAVVVVLSALPIEHAVPLAFVVLSIGFIVAWRTRLLARGVAFLGLKRLNAELRGASSSLREARLSEAGAHLQSAIPLSRHFGAYHATCVALSGVLRHLQGDSEGGLACADAALHSGWLSMRRTAETGAALRGWQAHMCLALGRYDEAEALLQATAPGPLPILLAAHQQNWSQVLERAEQAFETAQEGPPEKELESLLAHAAALGLFAARAGGAPEELWRERADAHPASALMCANPSVQPFL